MLNEKKEYELLLRQGYLSLLRNDNLRNDLAGIRSALTILARGFMDLCVKRGITDLSQKTDICHEFLKCWVIGEYNEDVDYPKEILGEFKKAKAACLARYIIDNKIKIKCLKDNQAETVVSYLSSKMAAWDKSMFYSYNKNSVNEIYFKSIIADALNKGELTNKRLAIKNDKMTFGIECSQISCRHLFCLLSIVGACLQHLPQGQKGSNVKMVELSNCVNKPTNRKTKRASVYSGVDGFIKGDLFTYKGKPIITKTEQAGSVIKFAINSEWQNEFDVKLVCDGEEISEGYIAFSDDDLLPQRFEA